MLFPNKQITFHRNKCPIIKVIFYNFKYLPAPSNAMKPISLLFVFLLLTLFSLLLSACTTQKFENPPDFCTDNSMCITSGCSNTLCASVQDEPVFTTCEYKYEYACYQNKSLATCGCVEHKCQWITQPGFESCMREKQALNSQIPIV